jgi:molecular chaperone DnaK (HSP70)
MAKYVGIDLGTTTTVVAQMDERGESIIVPSWLDCQPYTHSAFWFDGQGGRIPALVGIEARRLAGLNAGAFVEYKRFLGTSFQFKLGRQSFSPEFLTRTMLEHCLENLPGKEELSVLTITVPANFANRARTETLQAAKSAAGRRVDIRMIDEPTAVALYYASAFPSLPKGCYLVFDFGGGTLDVSAVDLDGRAVAVKSSVGEPALGGADFDRVLLEMLQERFMAKAKKALSRSASGLDYSKLEALKEELCGGSDISVKLKSQGGRATEYKLSSKEYLERTQPLVDKAVACAQKAISEAKLLRGDIQGVLLAGGSSSIPSIKVALKRMFGRVPLAENPRQVVALGAAVYSAYCAGSAPEVSPTIRLALDGMNFKDISPHHIGATVVDADGKKFNQIIIKKGEPRPVSKTVIHYVMENGESSVLCDVTQSSMPLKEIPDDRIRTIFDGEMELGPGARYGDPIHVTFSYDTNGLFKGIFYYPRNSRTVEFLGEM